MRPGALHRHRTPDDPGRKGEIVKIDGFGDAWKEWLNSEHGQSCQSGTATGEYLRNRLWWAFCAGFVIGRRQRPYIPEKTKGIAS
jgi:hypothetical protein